MKPAPEIAAERPSAAGDEPGLRGTNQSGMRAQNERLVLSLVRQHGALAKSDLARITGLSAQTVSVIMRALEDDGLLQKGKPVRGRVGQPSVPLSLAPDGAYFLGLKIGRRSAELVLTDFLGRITARRATRYPWPQPARTIRFAAGAVAELTAALPPDRTRRVAGLGVAIPFRLWDWTPAPGRPEADMSAWADCDIRVELERATGLPVFVENDASAACGAELVFGTSALPRDFLYVYVGFFVGGGVVLNGRLFTGPTGNAGALGSMPVPDGAGITRQLIDFASIAVLERMLLEAGQPAGQIWDSPGAWVAERATVDAWVAGASRALAHAIVSAASVIDFGAVLIDGWIPPELRRELTAATARALEGQNTAGLGRPVLREGTIGIDARSLGAACLPLADRFLADGGTIARRPAAGH